jgi:hypothetical protein
MSRLTVIGPAFAVLVAGLAVAAGTSAQAPGPPSGTIELVQRERDARFAGVDNPPRRKESPGDVFLIGGVLRHDDGRTAGRAAAMFTQTDRRRAVGTAVFKLAGGDIVATGALDDRGSADTSDTLAVVGGTGSYAGARGTAVVSEGQGETRFRLSLGS